MPWGDGTGPLGLGPMTGRRVGYCSGFPVPGYLNPVPGFAFSRGRGFRWYWRRLLLGVQTTSTISRTRFVPEELKLSKEEQRKILEEERKAIREEIKELKEELNTIEVRLKELENRKIKGE